MKRALIFFLLISSVSITTFSQYKSNLSSAQWVDSVFNTLTNEQRIAQLMIIRAHSNLGQDHINEVTRLINTYNVGGLCFFQGGPVRQATLTNYYQGIAKTPLFISIDGEWGLGMRLDSVINFPRQLMIGAVPDARLVYTFGRAVGEQCKRLGIHVNFAPDVDVNNNPNNPVINDRSFGEDKYKVSLFGIEYMKGMQDVGVMASAKHFPGHGDVAVDSHLDLPVINKSRSQLDSLELYPFRQLVKAGVGSVMIAHLYIPSIDSTPNQATSLSYKNVTGLLKDELGYEGLTFTDALEMKGVTKFYPAGEASAQSLIAGNDILLLPGDIEGSFTKILTAIQEGKLTWEDINKRVKKVLAAKYTAGLHQTTPVKIEGLTDDLNAKTTEINELLAINSLTLLRQKDISLLQTAKRIAYLGIGLEDSVKHVFARRMEQDFKADVFNFSYKKDLGSVPLLAATLKEKYDIVVVGLHNYNRRPANNFLISNASIELIKQVHSQMPAITLAFGNPYAIKNFDSASNLIAVYEDDSITQNSAANYLQGNFTAKGKLPVTATPDLKFGSGISYNNYFPLVEPEIVGLNSEKLSVIDSIANDAIANRATPGCVVFVAKSGKVAFHKAYGYTNYDSTEAVTPDMIYDLASVTKTSATTVAVMKLYEEGKLKLNKTLGDYLPWLRGSNKAQLTLQDVLLHQAGLVAWIPFYRETMDSLGRPIPGLYTRRQSDSFGVRVAEDMFIKNSWIDTMYQRIFTSPLTAKGKYIYSDNDFILLGKIVESITGKPLEDYVKETFYDPLQMTTTSFLPRAHFPLSAIAPTETEKGFREQTLWGDVHDPGAAMFGGVAGHAGLFSNAYDLAQLYQMLLNDGTLNGIRLLKKSTIKFFTAYHSTISRRGYGFDKPEKDNATRKDPYPTASVSPATFGHTGFTGTCVWADPKADLLYIFLSNRVASNDGDSNKLLKMNVRSNIHEAIYKAMPATIKLKKGKK